MIAKLEKHDLVTKELIAGGSLCTCEWIRGSPAKRGISEIIQDGGEPMVVDTPSWETVEVGYPWWAHTLLVILRIQKHPLLWFDKFEPFIHVRSEFDKAWLDCVVTLNISKHISISAPLICAIPTVFFLWAVVPSAEPFALSSIYIDIYCVSCTQIFKYSTSKYI